MTPANFAGSKWFTADELRCKGSGRLFIDQGSLDALNALREAVNRPLIINSGYRSPEYNKMIGGAPSSYHLKGQAFDIRASHYEQLELFYHASRVGFHGFGFYDTFIHLDTRPLLCFWGAKH